jgi:hypothetical protein
MILHTVPIAVPLAIGLGLLAGIAVGLIHFTQLQRSVRLLAAGRLGLAFATQALRVLVSAMLLAALAWLGVGALLAGLAGFLLSRQWLVRREKAAASVETQP